MTWVKIMTISAGATTIIGSITAAIIWLNSTLVWASDYQKDRAADHEFMIQMRIDILEDRRARSKDSNLKRQLDHKIERYQKQLEALDKRKLESKDGN